MTTLLAPETHDLPLEGGPTEAQRRRSLLLVRLAVAGAGAAMAIQMGLNENFLVQDIGVTGLQRGLLETFRETCGIIAFGVLAILAGLAEPVVGAAMLLLLGAGLSAYALVHGYAWVVAMSLVWSFGLHVWMPLPNAMTLALAEPGRAGYRLGQVAASGATGFFGGLAAAWLLTLAGVPMRPLYLLAGAAAVLAAGACLGIHRRLKTPGPRLVFRRKYALYYVLCFLDGWRKQIFICFAVFLLVRRHHAPLTTILVLWGAVQVIGYLASPHVGRLIDRVGERRVLLAYYPALVFVFLGYAFVQNLYVLFALFIADGAIFLLALALTTYVNRLAPKSEHTATLSMGVAMNHVAAVTMPLVGGLLWTYVDYRWTFLAGAAAAVLSIPAALCVPRHAPPPAPAQAA